MNRSNRRLILENLTCLSIPRGAYNYVCAMVGCTWHRYPPVHRLLEYMTGVLAYGEHGLLRLGTRRFSPSKMWLKLLTYSAWNPLRLLPFCSCIPKSDPIFHRRAYLLYRWLLSHSSLMISSTIDGSSPQWWITCVLANHLTSSSIWVMCST
jgi:hypothetical protein